jgi:hypothetical protein
MFGPPLLLSGGTSKHLFHLLDHTYTVLSRQVFGNKDGNPTLITTNSNDEDDNDFFARAEAQVAKRKAGMGTSTLGKLSIYANYVD